MLICGELGDGITVPDNIPGVAVIDNLAIGKWGRLPRRRRALAATSASRSGESESFAAPPRKEADEADEEVEADECVAVMREETEEGKKVTRNGGRKFVAVFRRVVDPPWPGES